MSFKDFVKLFGPAWIALMADADAASIIGGISTGEQYGYRMIWFVLILSIPLFFIQEASGKIGVITNSGIGKLIREYYSKNVSIIAIFPVFFIDFFTYLTEYTGIVIGSYLIGINPLIGLIIFFTLHIAIVLSKRYELTERILILISLILIIASTIAIFPKLYFNESIFYFSTSKSFLYYIAINIGAVVTPPCMLIYQSSSTAIKYSKIDVDQRTKIRWVSYETIIGSIITEILIVFSEIIGTGIGDINPLDPYQLILSLGYLHYIFGILLISSAFLTLIVVSLSSSWGLLEALNKNNFRNMLKIYTLESIPAIIIVSFMIKKFSVVLNFALTLLSLSPLVVTIPAILIGIILSNRKIMKENVYSRRRIIIYYVIIILIAVGGIIGFIR
ncbi:NRAMP family divalent metal transporter [Caldisphaera sp.]|uniref:NRAMP family divalent metal transporter n=1 Tax=Caldisphaera sp. TaxID=2060322 RepID=UPI0025B95AFB|nr:divalent metal cation transporter [Caldisphaera sp.]